MQKVKMLLTKPSYVGFVFLELSKLHMLKYAIQRYHPFFDMFSIPLNIHRHQSNEVIIVITMFDYEVIIARYGEKAHLVFTDTDSLMSNNEKRDV